jgi:hypothetical protein
VLSELMQTGPKKKKFYENPSSGSRVVACGPTDTDTHDEALVAFRNFTKAPKNVL